MGNNESSMVNGDDAAATTSEPTVEKIPADLVVDNRWAHDDESVHKAALNFPDTDGKLRVRRMEKQDVYAAADVCVASFNGFNATVGLEPEFPPRSVFDVPGMYYSWGATNDDDAGFVAFVAIDDKDEIVGANLLEYRDGVGGIGPICSSAPGAGKLLMMAVMRAAAERGVRSVRLLQLLPNTRSYSLYHGLGFEPRRVMGEYVAGASGCTAEAPPGIAVAPLTAADVEECSALHARVCGTPRAKDIAAAAAAPPPTAAARDENGRLVGYTTGSYLGGHTVAESEAAFCAIVVAQVNVIAGAKAAGAPLPPATLFVPQQYSRLSRWLVANGFRLNRQLCAMSYGPHLEPAGGLYFPCISY